MLYKSVKLDKKRSIAWFGKPLIPRERFQVQVCQENLKETFGLHFSQNMNYTIWIKVINTRY